MEESAEKTRNIPPSRKLWLAALILTAISVIPLTAGFFLLPGRDQGVAGQKTQADYGTYQYHIAVISDETDTSFWADVYQGAVEAGAGYGAYVEQVGDGLVDPFSMEDAINIAIYEHVDGILLRAAEDEKTRQMIDKAWSHQIPVITMQKDVPSSRRQGFVGINDYFLGQEYGKRVLKIAGPDTRLVTVLFPGTSFNETSRSWFKLGLGNTVQQEEIRLDFKIIWDDRGLNNAEEVIHDMAEGHVERPDILICLDEVLTRSACQLLRDRGLSGSIRVIGSYISHEILDGIEGGDIDSTITIDPEAMGRMSMDALMTYRRYHMVSYYTEVDTMLVDGASVPQYRREHGNEEDTDTGE